MYLNRHTSLGQSPVYRVTQLRTDGVHCRESAGKGSVAFKVVPNGFCLGRSLWTNQYAPLFPTPTIGMKWVVESTGVIYVSDSVCTLYMCSIVYVPYICVSDSVVGTLYMCSGTFNMPTSYQQWVWERGAYINWFMVTCQGSNRSELP